MYFLYIDESYESKSKYIVLTGFILPESEWAELNKKIKELKIKFFSDDSINLKSIRRKDYDEKQRFNKLSLEEKNKFNEEFYEILSKPEYTFMASLIDKDKMEATNKKFLFRMAYSFLIQRFQFFLQENNQRGIIIMDKSKNQEITSLFDYHITCLERGVPIKTKMIEFKGSGGEPIYIKDYEYMDLTHIVEHLFFLDDRYSNHLQIVDIICAAISSKFNRTRDYYYRKIEKNIRKCSKTGKIEGFGIKIFPN